MNIVPLILDTENKEREGLLNFKLQHVVTSEKGLVFTRNGLDMMISTYDDYCFKYIYIHTFVLDLLQDKDIFTG